MSTTTSSRQDRQGVRTATDLERKYNFGRSFAEVYGLIKETNQSISDSVGALDDKLDPDEIFNRLTNYGASQGIYRENGDIYINASYIKSGKITADYIDATDLHVDAANIDGTLTAENIDTSNLKVNAANVTGKLTAAQIETDDLQVYAANIQGILQASQINADDLYIKAANITGLLQASQINADDLHVQAANISGQLVASQINTTNLTVTSANIVGTLSADQIDASDLHVSAANIDGTLTADQIELTGSVSYTDMDSQMLSALNAMAQDAATAYSTATSVSNTVSGWTYSGTTMINGAMIQTGTVRASILEGGYIGMLDAYGSTAGNITLGSSSSASARVQFVSSGAMLLAASAGSVYIQCPGTLGLHGADTTNNGNLYPTGSDVYSCGTYGFKWSQVYAATGTINTSDRNAKHDITYDMSRYDAMYEALQPVYCKYNDSKSDRWHTAFIAQDVEEAMTAAGLTDKDFAGLIKDQNADGSMGYGLRYSEFIPLNTYMIQKLMARVAELERRIAQ